MSTMLLLDVGGSGTDWSPLVNTLLGGLLAVGGGAVGALLAERRADNREERAREHEREVWARGLRHEAHVAFLSILDARFNVIQAGMDDPMSGDVPEDYLVPVWDRYQAVRLVCTKNAAEKAEQVVEALMDYAYRSGRWELVEYRRDGYLGAVREEFHLPPIPLMGD